MSKQSKHNKTGLWVVAVLLAITFTIFYFSAGRYLFTYFETSDWSSTQGQLQSLKLKTNHDDTTTYKVVGRYSYEVNGQQFSSSNISIHKGSDNVGEYWQELYQELKRQQKSGSVSVLYDPDFPGNAVLDRTFRWFKLVFALLFVLVFGGFAAGIFLGSWNAETKQKRATSKERLAHIMFLWFGAVFLSVGLLVASLGLSSELRNGNYAILLVLLFPLAGLWFIFAGLKKRRAYHFYGRSPLELDPASPIIGGQLGGRVKLNTRASELMQQGVFQSVLTCSRYDYRGKKSRTSLCWQEFAPVALESRGEGLEASFLFDVPADQFPSGDTGSNERFDWEVRIEPLESSSQSIPLLKRSWPVEVLVDEQVNTASLVSSIVIPSSVRDAFEDARSSKAKESALEQIPFVDDGRFIHMLSGTRLNRVSSIFGLLFSVIFVVVGYISTNDGWWPGYIFLLIGFFALVASVFSMGSSVKVKIDKTARLMHTSHRWFGMQYAHHDIALYDTKQFSLKRTSTTTQGTEQIGYYKLFANKDGDKVTLARGIKGKNAAKALQQKLLDVLF